jgi:hypothetical protein
VLKHAVSEAAGGSSDVGAEKAGKVDVPVGEGGFKLESAAADVAKIATEEADGGVGGYRVARLVELLLVDEDAAGEDESLGAFAGGDEAALDEQFVQARFHGKIFTGLVVLSGFSQGQHIAS